MCECSCMCRHACMEAEDKPWGSFLRTCVSWFFVLFLLYIVLFETGSAAEIWRAPIG